MSDETIKDDFSVLTGANHYLDWVGDDIEASIRAEFERILREQIASSELIWVRLLGEPQFLTGGRPDPKAANNLRVTRAAFAVSFELVVRSEGSTYGLRGVLSWVASGLDGQRNGRVYMDLDTTLEWATEALKLRIYENDAPTAEPPKPPKSQKSPWKFWQR